MDQKDQPSKPARKKSKMISRQKTQTIQAPNVIPAPNPNPSLVNSNVKTIKNLRTQK